MTYYVIACPIGFLTSGSGIEKGCKKDFNKYQYLKKFVFQCHTVTHGINFRKSPRDCFYQFWSEFEISQYQCGGWGQCASDVD